MRVNGNSKIILIGSVCDTCMVIIPQMQILSFNLFHCKSKSSTLSSRKVLKLARIMTCHPPKHKNKKKEKELRYVYKINPMQAEINNELLLGSRAVTKAAALK